MSAPERSLMAEDWPRRAGALALALVTVLTLRLAHAGLVSALLAGAAAALFTAWRTVPGVCAGFAVFCGAAALAWSGHDVGSLSDLAVALPWALALEVFGLATILAVALVRRPRRVSRRLLGSFLASSGLGLLGVALCSGAATRSVGGALIVGALAYRLGAVPAYGWVPMLLRHPRPAVKGMGVAGIVGADAVLALVLPLLDRVSAAAALGALSAVTIPWAGARAWRARTSDPPCARTYVIVVAISAILLVVAARLAR